MRKLPGKDIPGNPNPPTSPINKGEGTGKGKGKKKKKGANS